MKQKENALRPRQYLILKVPMVCYLRVALFSFYWWAQMNFLSQRIFLKIENGLFFLLGTYVAKCLDSISGEKRISEHLAPKNVFWSRRLELFFDRWARQSPKTCSPEAICLETLNQSRSRNWWTLRKHGDFFTFQTRKRVASPNSKGAPCAISNVIRFPIGVLNEMLLFGGWSIPIRENLYTDHGSEYK